uniref:Histone deacetylase 11 n=1 Tax=Globodera rostochiensis TaxID=31243 RepID=A0A914HJB4_GLORO
MNTLEGQRPTSISAEKYSYLYDSADEVWGDGRCAIVYTDEYNISFFGIEKCHPFDSKKWGHVFQLLTESGALDESAVLRPKEARNEDLLLVHSEEYLHSLGSRLTLTRILEVGLVLFFPNWLVNRRVLRPMRFQTGGTVLAARISLLKGWAINIGGGFHHASGGRGGGFCVYADITLAIRILFMSELIRSAMIVDVDAHQGNGHERDFAADRRVYILDLFNAHIYPHDEVAKTSISRAVPLDVGTEDDIYLRRLDRELGAAFRDFPSPDVLIYVAGTDSLADDPLGLLRLSPQGIIRRDELVFRAAIQRQVPVTMVTSGGYTNRSAKVISDSILNLNKKGLIQLT